MSDICSLEDVRKMVDCFYDSVRKDNLLGPIFNEIIQDRWVLHLEKMYTFWQTVLLDEHTYFGSPFLPHAKMPVDIQHFDRWKALFNANIDSCFEGEKADKAKWQAARMADLFLAKISYYQSNKAIPLQ